MKGWRTVIFNTLTIVAAILAAINWDSLGFTVKGMAYILAAQAAINVVLRVFTDTAIGKSS